ncbi:MAG: outer membrane beta-barrel protein [Chitinophagaceae bacterium]
MKVVLLNIFLVSIMTQFVNAQSVIRGTVADDSGNPLSNVNVLLLHSNDSSLMKGVVSDHTGNYSFTGVGTGKYLVGFSFIGYKKAYTTDYSISSGQDNILINEIRLKAEGEQLKKVTVTAKKPLFEQKTDRLVINVRNSITSAGSTVLDVLERSPGVVVDRQNNAIAMGGKDGVVVLINGKESNLPIAAVVQMLAGMNSANIERIELITTPPSNFSAEGNAGFINIVLIENNSFGTNGSFTVSVGGGKGKMSSAALNFNHRKGRINLYGDYSFTRTRVPQIFVNYRTFEYGGQIKTSDVVSNRDTRILNFTGRMGIDLQLSKATTIGASLAGYTNKWTMDAIIHASFLVDEQVDTLTTTLNDELNKWQSVSANMNVQHNFKKAGKLTVNLDYLNYDNRNPNNYSNDYFNGAGHLVYEQEAKTEKLTPIEFWVGSVDYSIKSPNGTEWQAGIKHNRSGFNNDILVSRFLQNTWVTDGSYSTEHELKENNSAAYISITPKINPKTTMKLGLRYEYINSVLTNADAKKVVDRHYGKLFPSFFISRKINDDNTINFSYSRRITRPSFNELAPFTIFMDPNNFITGNPTLQAAIANAVSTSYSFKKYIASISYSYEVGSISRFQSEIDPMTNKQLSTPQNLKNLKVIAATIAVPLTLAPWWSVQMSVIGKWQRINLFYKGSPIQVEQKNFRITSTQSFKLNDKISIDLSAFYQSADLSGLNMRKPFGTVDFGIQHKIKNGKLIFGVTDIFVTSRGIIHFSVPENSLVGGRRMLFTQRLFKLTYTRSFGNSKLESKRRVDNSEEERKRVE